MENNSKVYYKDIIFASSNSIEIRKTKKLLDNGLIRKIAPKIYSANLNDNPADIIRTNLFEILSHLYPGALLSHRSAIEFKPTSKNIIFLTYTYTKKITLPGITITLLEGNPSIEGDNLFYGTLFASQFERALLENFQISKKPGAESKTLTIPEIEEKLESIIRVKGESELNIVRDKARDISVKLNMQYEFNRLNTIISALLSTKPVTNLKSKIAIARAIGSPYDRERKRIFEILFQSLITKTFPDRHEKNDTSKSFRNFAFFESYFSNYIEGTKFEISDAKNIIESGIPLPGRPDDSHDILGTYKIVSSINNIGIVPENYAHFIELLLTRHKILMEGRPYYLPGEFKNKNNHAGNTYFVDFTLVRGTLEQGFEYYKALRDPFAKAAYLMFLISEVHPFIDGNGRTARLFMNSELVANNQSKILIPTVYREDYLLSLRKLSRQRDTEPYIKMLDRIHQFSETITGEDIDEMQNYLESRNAFKDSEDSYKLKF